jgi:uncharacterized membrane protein YeaQ/YmgE (transglycosylase-associated protein family)
MGLSVSILRTGGRRARPSRARGRATVEAGRHPLPFAGSPLPLVRGDRQLGRPTLDYSIIAARAIDRLRKDSQLGIESLLVFLIVGAIAGWLAGLIVKGGGFGILGNIVVGIVGAFIAGLIFPTLGFALGGGILAAIIHATIGAVILLVVIRLVKRA